MPYSSYSLINLFYIPNPTQYLNLTTNLLTINKQQIGNLF